MTYADVLIEVPDEAAELLANHAPHRFVNMDSTKPELIIGGVSYEGVVRPVVGSHLLFHSSGAYRGVAEVRIVFNKLNPGSDADGGEEIKDAKKLPRKKTGKTGEKVKATKPKNNEEEKQIKEG